MKGYKTLCETCGGTDGEPKQIGALRPDTNIGRVRADMDRKCHAHETKRVEVEIEPRTKAGFTFDEVGE